MFDISGIYRVSKCRPYTITGFACQEMSEASEELGRPGPRWDSFSGTSKKS